MSTRRRWAIGLTVVAVVLWTALVVAVVATPAEEGANIGAGLLFMLAVPCTVTGVALLIASGRTRQEAVQEGPDQRPTSAVAVPVQSPVTGEQSNPVASWSLTIGIVGVVLSLAPIGDTEGAVLTAMVVAVVLCLLATALGWVGLRRARARGGVNRGLALAGTIVGATGLGLNLVLILELALFLTGDL